MPLLENSSGLFAGQPGSLSVGMLLVAASLVSASMAADAILTTADNLHAEAQQAGQEATDPLAQGPDVEQIVVGGDQSGIQQIAFYVRSGVGSGDVQLDEATVEIEQGAIDAKLAMQDTEPCSASTTPMIPGDGRGEFCVEAVTNPSGDESPYQLSGNDLVKISVFTPEDQRIETNEDVDARIVLDSGGITEVSFATPATMGGQEFKIVG